MKTEGMKLGLMVAALLSVTALPTSPALAKDAKGDDRRPAATERRDTGRDTGWSDRRDAGKDRDTGWDRRDGDRDNGRDRRDGDRYDGGRVAVRIGWDRPAYVAGGYYTTRTQEVLVEAAHYETRTTQVCVEEGYWDTRYVPAVEEVYRDRHGDIRRVVVAPARIERVWVPAVYETRTVRVWVPAVYETRTVQVWVPAYYAGPAPIRGGISIGGIFRW